MEKNRLFGFRGAITADKNDADAIFEATVEMVKNITELNNIEKEDIVHAIFTVSPDITADFPAKAARIGFMWDDVPMICSQEIDVKLPIKYCIRVLITAYSSFKRNEIKHVYLKDAAKLRPDLSLDE